MIPRWQIVGVFLLVLVAVAADILLFPNSYAHAYLWGQCRKTPAPPVCTRDLGRGYRGRMTP